MEIREIIIVEGKSDTQKIKEAVLADTIETNGSAINKETLKVIKHAQEKRGVIIFTDPDYPGERIRNIITREVRGCKHAFLPKERARAKSNLKSLGIEHASIDSIREALQNVHDSDSPLIKSDITKKELISYGLVGSVDASRKREQLGRYLHIGHTNGKQLLKRLHMFQITKDELDSAMTHILERGQGDA